MGDWRVADSDGTEAPSPAAAAASWRTHLCGATARRQAPALHSYLRSRRGGCLGKLLVLGVVFAAVVALAWMLCLPLVVTDRIRARTGFEARVSSLSCNVFTGKLTVRGLVLGNPASFPTRDFMELREFHAEGDLGSLLSERVVLDALTIDVRKVTLVRRADGRSNADIFGQNLFGLTLPPTSPNPTAPAIPTPPKAATAEPVRKFLIRRLTLRFDELVLEDRTGPQPVVQDYKLSLDQRYENVTEAKQLLVPEVLQRVAAANLGPLLGALVPGDFGGALRDKALEMKQRGGEALKEAGQRGADLFKGMREKLEETRKP